MTQFVDTTIKQIDGRLRELSREVASLERARAALTNGTHGRGRASSAVTSTNGRRRTTSTPRGRRAGGARAAQALELVRSRPGITIPEIAQAMEIQPNYLYRVLPRLASEGQVSRAGNGWHAGASISTNATTAKPQRRRRAQAPSPSSNRTSRRSGDSRTRRAASGGTTRSVLAALAGGKAMTASEVAAKAGLARPTVSTTLSKLARGGRVEKAKRGYRLASAA